MRFNITYVIIELKYDFCDKQGRFRKNKIIIQTKLLLIVQLIDSGL